MSNQEGRINYNGIWIPSSATTKIVRCPDPGCKHIHFIAFDKFGVPICEMTVNADMIENAQHLLQGVG